MEVDKQLLEELKADLRKDKFLNFIKKYKNHIIIIICLVVIAIGGIFAYKSHISSKAVKNSIIFMSAKEKITDTNTEEALDILNSLIKDGTHGYKFLSYMEKASILISQAKVDEAVLVLQEAHKVTSLSSYYKDLIKSIELMVRMNHDEDLIKLATDIKSSLNKKSSFYFFNLEIYGAILVQQGSYKEGLEVFNEILSSEHVPSDVTARAKRVKGLLIGYLS